MAESKKITNSEELNVLRCVSVCRSFRLEGLQTVLIQIHSKVEPVKLIWDIGDLSAKGYISGGRYVVNHKKVKDVIQKLEKSLRCELHKKWGEWYQGEFEKKGNVEDLAELLYHEASYLKESDPGGDVLEYLKSEAKEHLSFYTSKHLKDKPEELTEYIKNLIEQLEREDLDRIDWILEPIEHEAFIKFLNSLNF